MTPHNSSNDNGNGNGNDNEHGLAYRTCPWHTQMKKDGNKFPRPVLKNYLPSVSPPSQYTVQLCVFFFIYQAAQMSLDGQDRRPDEAHAAPAAPATNASATAGIVGSTGPSSGGGEADNSGR